MSLILFLKDAIYKCYHAVFVFLCLADYTKRICFLYNTLTISPKLPLPSARSWGLRAVSLGSCKLSIPPSLLSMSPLLLSQMDQRIHLEEQNWIWGSSLALIRAAVPGRSKWAMDRNMLLRFEGSGGWSKKRYAHERWKHASFNKVVLEQVWWERKSSIAWEYQSTGTI